MLCSLRMLFSRYIPWSCTSIHKRVHQPKASHVSSKSRCGHWNINAMLLTSFFDKTHYWLMDERANLDASENLSCLSMFVHLFWWVHLRRHQIINRNIDYDVVTVVLMLSDFCSFVEYGTVCQSMYRNGCKLKYLISRTKPFKLSWQAKMNGCNTLIMVC